MILKELLTYKVGGGVPIDGTDSDIQGFHGELKKRFPELNVTSALRKGNGVGKAGSKSRHNRGQAMDIAPNSKIKQFLESQEGISLMNKYKVGFLDETDPATMKKTGATGAHYHVGKDSTLVGKHSYGENNTSRTPYVPPPDMAYINWQNPESSQKSFQGFDFSTLPAETQQTVLENQKLEQDRLNQELMADKLKQENLAIEQELKQKQTDREQMINMLPQAEYIGSNLKRNPYTELLQNQQVMQKGGMINGREVNVGEIKQFYNTMLSSQWYKNRLLKNGYGYNNPAEESSFSNDTMSFGQEEKVNKIANARNKNVQSTVIDPVFTTEGTNYKRERGNIDKLNIRSITDIPYTKEIEVDPAQLKRNNIHPRSAITHEFGHSETDSYSGGEYYGDTDVFTAISRDEVNMYKKNKKTPKTEHGEYVTNPLEAKGDINSIRYNLNKVNLFNPKTGKYKTKDGKFDKTMIQHIKTDYNLNRMLDAYGEKGLIDLMNTIAQNQKLDKEVTYVKKGGMLNSQKIK